MLDDERGCMRFWDKGLGLGGQIIPAPKPETFQTLTPICDKVSSGRCNLLLWGFTPAFQTEA